VAAFRARREYRGLMTAHDAPDQSSKTGPAAKTGQASDGSAGGAERIDEAARIDETPPPAQRERRAQEMGRRVPLVAGVSALIIAVLLGGLIALRAGELFELDEEWAEDVLTLRGPVGDLFANLMNVLGGGFFAIWVIPIGGALLLLVFRRPWGALYFILVSAASAGVVQLMKQLFARERPEDMMVISDFGSFPSGHTANAATIAVALAIIAPRAWVIIVGIAYTVLMAISRTYLGAHWFTDTVAGILVGAGVALLIWALLARPLERERLAWTTRRAELNAARAQSHITPPAVRR
jgi:undecaprenyl-diphosphatase